MVLAIFDRVRDTTTTIGTGAVTVSGVAPITYRTLSAVCSVNDTAPYVIIHRSVNEWETGIGTYSSSNVLTRTTVLQSSNANAAVNFSAGTKDVVLTITARNAFAREILQANRTYYVRSDGSNSNTGLVNSAGGAFLTFNYAYGVIAATLDLAGYTVTVQGAAGTYTGGLAISQAWTGGGGISFIGDESTPSNVVMSTTALDCVNVTATLPGRVRVSGFKLQTASGNSGFYHAGAGLLVAGAIEYGACTTAHLYLNGPGANLQIDAAHSITGATTFHIVIGAPGGFFYNASACTITGSLAITYFAYNTRASVINDTGGYTGGTVTGTRYSAITNRVIDVSGAGANYFPGSIAGSTGSGGQYV